MPVRKPSLWTTPVDNRHDPLAPGIEVPHHRWHRLGAHAPLLRQSATAGPWWGSGGGVLVSGGVLLSRVVAHAVPSALGGLASGFGMGPGVSPPL